MFMLLGVAWKVETFWKKHSGRNILREFPTASTWSPISEDTGRGWLV